MAERMPRVAQTLSVDEENSINANSNKCERSDGHLNLAADINHGSKGRIILYDDIIYPEDDESLYSLRCVIDGKAKRFKKDSRVWLHKSSTKCKRKPEQNLSKLEDIETPRKLVKFEEDKGTSSLHNRVKENPTNEQGNESELSEFALSETYDKFYSRRSEIVSDLTSLSDSDADLTYSEETTPTKTESSCVESERTVMSQSSTSLVTNDVESQDDIRLADFDEPSLSEDLEASSESLEVLDLCNQSTNSAPYSTTLPSNKCCPIKYPHTNSAQTRSTKRAIPRQLAPAIDIEDESIRDNLLDYCVNLTVRDSNPTKNVAYRTRLSSKSRGGVATSNASGRTLRQKQLTRKNNKRNNENRVRNHSLKKHKKVSKSIETNKLHMDSTTRQDQITTATRGLQSDQTPGCSTQPGITLPMSLLCLATLALLKDTNPLF